MEFPVLMKLPIPLSAIRLITQFAWEPHPTALLIKALKFERRQEDDIAVLYVTGEGVRYLNQLSRPSFWPPDEDSFLEFSVREHTGDILTSFQF